MDIRYGSFAGMLTFDFIVSTSSLNVPVTESWILEQQANTNTEIPEYGIRKYGNTNTQIRECEVEYGHYRA